MAAKQRTSKSKANKRNSTSSWVIAVVLAIVVATGAFLVYQSFASGGSSTIRTIYCGSGRCSDVRVESNWQPKSAYTRYKMCIRDSSTVQSHLPNQPMENLEQPAI